MGSSYLISFQDPCQQPSPSKSKHIWCQDTAWPNGPPTTEAAATEQLLQFQSSLCLDTCGTCSHWLSTPAPLLCGLLKLAATALLPVWYFVPLGIALTCQGLASGLWLAEGEEVRTPVA